MVGLNHATFEHLSCINVLRTVPPINRCLLYAAREATHPAYLQIYAAREKLCSLDYVHLGSLVTLCDLYYEISKKIANLLPRTAWLIQQRH